MNVSKFASAIVVLGAQMGFAAQLSTGKAWDTLDRSLRSGSVTHRSAALAAISTLPASNEEAVKRAEAALHDHDPRVRKAAALALGQMKAKQAVPQLREALGDTGEVAFAAAKALIDCGDTEGRDMLIAVLAGERKDTPGMMTNAIREAHQKLKHPEGLMFMGVEDATGAMFGPAAMGLTAAKDAIDLKGKGAPGRAAAAAYLAKDPEPYAVTLLEWALTDDNQFVRIEAAKGLGERGNIGSIAKLEPLLQDAHTGVRDMAAAAIIRIEGKAVQTTAR